MCRYHLQAHQAYTSSKKVHGASHAILSRGLGETSVKATIAIDDAAKTTTMILTGPQGNWFALGTGQSAMKGYAVVVDEMGKVHERSMNGPGDPGANDLDAMITVVRRDVNASAGTTTLVLQRNSAGKSADYIHSIQALSIQAQAYQQSAPSAPSRGLQASLPTSMRTLDPSWAAQLQRQNRSMQTRTKRRTRF